MGIRYAGILSLVLAILLLVGCSDSNSLTWNNILQPPAPLEEAQPLEEAAPDTLRLSMPKETGEWNPITNTSPAMQGLMQLSFEPLVRLDDSLKPTPCLAESWRLDGTTLTIILRRGIYFHDGSALTARDVTRTLDEILLAGEEGPYYASLKGLESWLAQDDRTLSIQTTGIGYAALYQMTFPVLRSAGEGAISGTGPFELTEYIPGQTLRLSLQSHWWKQTPLIASITAQSAQDHEEELAGRALDVYDLVRTHSMTASLYRAAGVTEVQDYRTQGYDLLAFNFDRPVMAQQLVRQSIASTINRADIISTIYQNHAVSSEGPIPPDHWLYAIQPEERQSDASITFRLLAQAGFVDYDGDGLFDAPPVALRDPSDPNASQGDEPNPDTPPQAPPSQGEEGEEEDGLPMPVSPEAQNYMTFTLLTNYDRESPVRRDAAHRIAEQLKAIGFVVTVKEVSLESLPEQIEEGEYDMLLIGYQMPLSGDLRFLLHSQAIEEQAGVRITRYADPAMDALLEQAATAANDTAYREALVSIQQKVQSEAPFVGLYFRSGTLVYNADLVMTKAQRDDEQFRGIETWQFLQ